MKGRKKRGGWGTNSSIQFLLASCCSIWIFASDLEKITMNAFSIVVVVYREMQT